MKSNDKKASFISKNEFPVEIKIITGTMGEKNIDIQNLNRHGYFSFDPGFTSTALCESKITYINGKTGLLLYRGFPINQLVLASNYLEVCYILLYGEKPNCNQYNFFCNSIKKYSDIHKKIIQIFEGFQKKSHPMAILCGATIALASYYHDLLNINIKEHREIETLHLIAKMPILIAMCKKRIFGEKIKIFYNFDLSYAGNLLYMMFSTSEKNYIVNPILEKAINKILIIHADHEQNVSTSTVRLVGSSGINLFACIAAGITSLWGKSHGGANEACLYMLEKINKIKNIPKYLDRAKNKNDSFRLMGFGHRIYKNYDPRAILMRDTCYEVIKELKVSDHLFEIAIELESAALRDSYFIERKLYPNVDFYSGIILELIGIPRKMFTAIFALSRTIGWVSHWNEMHDNGLKLARPGQLYSGYKEREFKN